MIRAAAMLAAVFAVAALGHGVLGAGPDGGAAGAPTGWTPLLVMEAMVTGLALVAIALCSVLESALVAASRPLVRRLAEHGDHRAVELRALLDEGGDGTITALVLTISTSILIVATFVGHLTSRLLGWEYYHLTAVGVLLFMLVFCEIVPKTFGSHHADRTALRAVGWLGPLVRSLPMRSLVLTVRSASWPLRHLLGVPETVARRGMSGEELASLADVAEEHDVLGRTEAQMFESIVEFGARTAREIMVPRIDMITVQGDADLAEAVRLISHEGKSRIVVVEEDADIVVGILYANDVLASLHRGEVGRKARELARPAFMVPETKPVDQLFRELRQRRTHIALVIDEYGGVDGLVTMEDVIEEIIGDVRDEHDAREVQAVRVLGPDTYLIRAGAGRHQVEEALGMEFGEDAGEFDTLGGFLFTRADGLPQPGFAAECGGYRFEVLSVKGPRITGVRAERLAPPTPEGAD